MSNADPRSDRRPRILVVTETFPWPVISGYQRRLTTVLGALRAIGTVDLWTATLGTAPELCTAPESAGIARVHVFGGIRRRALVARVLRWLTGRLPRGQVEFDARAARADLQTWAAPAYDIIWCAHLRTFLWTAGAVRGPIILDLDDLGNAMLGHRRRMLRSTSRGRRRWVPRTIASRVADMIDERRYRRLQRRVAGQSAATAVCSKLDRDRVRIENAVIIPNTYPAPDPPAMLHEPSPDAPCLLMVGLFTYAPNRDGARFFVHEVFPLVRDALPGARLRLVGRHTNELDDLEETAGVELVGAVPEIDPELRNADAVVVPLRFGGGTRVKLLEAFAYRVPAVSTTVGCEGLDATPGTHLLMADDPKDLAKACIAAVRDSALRRALTDSAFELFDQQHRPESAERAITDVVGAVLSSAPASVTPPS